MSVLSDIDARILQAVIAGGFVAVGWVVNGRRNRREARNLRAEKKRDVHRALYAEISSYMNTLWDEELLTSHGALICDKMQQDTDFVPFIPREHNDKVFDTILPQVHVLPRQTIDPIVIYYTHVKAISTLIDDLRDADFKTMSAQRRIAMYLDYIAMKKQALVMGRFALAMIATYEDGGPEAAEKLSETLNSQAVDRANDPTNTQLNVAEGDINNPVTDLSGRSRE